MDTMFLDQAQTADFLKLSERTLERMRWKGDGPKFVKLGRRTVYRQSDLIEWANARVFSSTTEAQLAKVAR